MFAHEKEKGKPNAPKPSPKLERASTLNEDLGKKLRRMTSLGISADVAKVELFPSSAGRGSMHVEKAKAAAQGQIRGPERFFYDATTYTGVHKVGGPSTVDTYTSDLKNMVAGRKKANVRGVVPNREMDPSDLGRHLKRDDISSRQIPATPPRPNSAAAPRAASAAPHNRPDSAAQARTHSPAPRPHSPAPRPHSPAPRAHSPVPPRDQNFHARPVSAQNPRHVRGPERFFYDTSTYTGVHKAGGPTTVDTNTADLHYMVHDRVPADVRGVPIHNNIRQRSHSPAPPSRQPWNDEDIQRKNRSQTPTPPSHHPVHEAHANDKNETRLTPPQSSRTPRGPERFFYDKSTYTGVHTKGGPSTVDTVTSDLRNIIGERKKADVRGVPAGAVQSKP